MQLIPQGNILWIENGGIPHLNDRYPIVGFLLWGEERYSIIEVNNVLDGVQLKEYWLDSGIRIRDTMYANFKNHQYLDLAYGKFIKENPKDVPRDRKGDLFESSLISTNAYKTVIPIECELPETYKSLSNIDLDLAKYLNFVDDEYNDINVFSWRDYRSRIPALVFETVHTRKTEFKKFGGNISLEEHKRMGYFKFMFGAWKAFGDWDGGSDRFLFNTGNYPNLARKYESGLTFEEAFIEYIEDVYNHYKRGYRGVMRKEIYWGMITLWLGLEAWWNRKELIAGLKEGAGKTWEWIACVFNNECNFVGPERCPNTRKIQWILKDGTTTTSWWDAWGKDALIGAAVICMIIAIGGFEITRSFYGELRCRIKPEFVPTTTGDPVNHYPPDPLFFGSGF